MGNSLYIYLKVLLTRALAPGRSDIAGQYLGIATMLIESYALDTLWNIGTIISYSLKYAPTVNLFITCTIQVDVSNHPKSLFLGDVV